MSLEHLLRLADLSWSKRCEMATLSERIRGRVVLTLGRGFLGARWILIVLLILTASVLSRRIV